MPAQCGIQHYTSSPAYVCEGSKPHYGAQWRLTETWNTDQAIYTVVLNTGDRKFASRAANSRDRVEWRTTPMHTVEETNLRFSSM